MIGKVENKVFLWHRVGLALPALSFPLPYEVTFWKEQKYVALP